MYETLDKGALEDRILNKVEKGNQAIMRLCLDIAKDSSIVLPDAVEMNRKVGVNTIHISMDAGRSIIMPKHLNYIVQLVFAGFMRCILCMLFSGNCHTEQSQILYSSIARCQERSSFNSVMAKYDSIG